MGWRFCIFANKYKGVGFIVKKTIQYVIAITGVALGVAFWAASFLMLRSYRSDYAHLKGRVENLEYESLREAYRQAGFEVD